MITLAPTGLPGIAYDFQPKSESIFVYSYIVEADLEVRMSASADCETRMIADADLETRLTALADMEI